MQAIRKLIGIVLQASALVLAVGCGFTGQPASRQADSDLGTVLLPDGTTLAREARAQAAVRPATNLALVVARDGGWSRVLAADGTHGWTAAALPPPGPVTVQCPPRSSELFRQSPDEISPESSESAAATAAIGTLLGASTKGYPASQSVLLAPARYQVVMPTLHVRCGVEGYAPPEWFRLHFESPEFERVNGLVRQPFLAGVVETLLARRPSANDSTMTFLEDRLVAEQPGASWTDVAAFYRDPADAARTLTVFASESARLFQFSQPSVRLHFSTYQPYPVRILSSAGEWFVEVVSIFGDGAYSTLFRIQRDGSVAFHPLSRSSGELDADTTASWGLLGSDLWIARATAGNVMLSGVATPLYLVALRTVPEFSTPLEPGVEMFPTNDGAWIAAVPFRTEAEASQNASGRSLRRYPR